MKGKFSIGVLILALAIAGLAVAAPPTHTVTVTLNYDFTVDNGCSATVTTGTTVKLFSIPAPSGANTALTGITGSQSGVTLKSGIHTFAATAVMADNTESSPNASTATATVLPGAPVNFSLGVQ